MKRRQFLAACLAVAALLTGGLPAGAFYDTPPAWAAEHLANLEENGLFYNFSTDLESASPIHRGQFCQLLVNLVQKEMTPTLFAAHPARESGYFPDMAGTAAAYAGGQNDIYYAAAYGITEGTMVNGQRLADVSALLTREQAAKMMCAAIDFLEESVLGAPVAQRGDAVSFADAASISAWAADAVAQASALGLMQGDEAGRFNPGGTITWNEACAMVSRAFDAAEAVRREQLAGTGRYLLRSQRSVETSNYVYWGDEPLWLLPEEDGGYTVVSVEEARLQVETFDSSGVSRGLRTLPAELPVFGGFYVGEDGCYAAYGQANTEEDDGKEVYRVVKYDADWDRVGAASVTGGESHTIRPYYYTDRTAMAEEDGVLVLHTARLRYTSDDGLNHQSNFTLKIRTSDMKVLEKSPAFPANHVSHSFAQDVVFSDGAPVYADLGDAYPRSFAVSLDSGDQAEVLPFLGATGDNTTHAALGGLAASADCYLLAGASAPQTDAASWQTERMNALLAVVPKDGFPRAESDVQWLTGCTDGRAWVEDVRLVTVNDNTFVVLWQARDADGVMGDLCWAVFDGRGRQQGDTRTMADVSLPTGNVAVVGDTLMWVRPERCGTGAGTGWAPTRNLAVCTLRVDVNGATGGEGPTLTLSRDAMTLSVGEQRLLGFDTSAPEGSYTLDFYTDDYGVAFIYPDGTVEGVGPGTATLTAALRWGGPDLHRHLRGHGGVSRRKNLLTSIRKRNTIGDGYVCPSHIFCAAPEVPP